jgi:AAA15 family ATPase/GTPase
MLFINEDKRKNLPTIRIKEIYIENFRNVKKGNILCECGRKYIEHGTEPDIIGLYGQNGSGKTSVILALQILKNVMSGMGSYDFFADYINVDSSYAFFCYTFDLQYLDGKRREVIYSFKMKKKEKNISNRIISTKGYIFDAAENYINGKYGAAIFDECIQMSGDFYGKRIKKQTIIDTSLNDLNYPFGPASKREFFYNDENKNVLIGNKISAEKNFSSYIFEFDTMEAFEKQKSEYYYVLEELSFFAGRKLFVISTGDYGLIQVSKLLPLYTKKNTVANFNFKLMEGFVNDEMNSVVGTASEQLSSEQEILNNLSINHPVYFSLSSQEPIMKSIYPIIEKEINRISVVLSSVIPGTEIYLKKGNETTDKNGFESFYAELMIKKDGKEMPLKYESDGTLKMISMLNCLIMAFNDESITVAIDELDSGVFEYLLGEILQVFEEAGRGQLFFTSHNLRPLEVLNKKYLFFTTTDENNRFVHLKNIGKTNNLRNVYFREILGMEGGDIKLYSGTQKYKIAAAFRKAGADE